MERKYQHCPDCRVRMKRTGKKELIVSPTIVRGKFYEREYKCPNCGRVLTHNELKNFIF